MILLALSEGISPGATSLETCSWDYLFQPMLSHTANQLSKRKQKHEPDIYSALRETIDTVWHPHQVLR